MENKHVAVTPLPQPLQTSESQGFVQLGMVPSGLVMPINEPIECRISCADHPYKFYAVTWKHDKLFKSNMKKFCKEYANMNEEQIQEATPTAEFLSHRGAVAAAFYKGRWNRISIEKQLEKSYEVCFIDTGDLREIEVSNILRLYKKHLVNWPAMAIPCSFIRVRIDHTAFLLGPGYATFFRHITEANPNCIVTSHGPFVFDNVLYSDVDVEIMKHAALPESQRNQPGLTVDKYNLLHRLQARFICTDSLLTMISISTSTGSNLKMAPGLVPGINHKNAVVNSVGWHGNNH